VGVLCTRSFSCFVDESDSTGYVDVLEREAIYSENLLDMLKFGYLFGLRMESFASVCWRADDGTSYEPVGDAKFSARVCLFW
jgi:hypothetical protein